MPTPQPGNAAGRPPDALRRVVVLGGGFGGLYAARAIAARNLSSRIDIALVDRSDVFVFKPLLYELLTDEVEEADVAFPYGAILAGTGIRHVRADVAAVDLAARTARTSEVEQGCSTSDRGSGSSRAASGSPGGLCLPGTERSRLSPRLPAGDLPFDAAVLALGAGPFFRGLPGLGERALPVARLEDFRRLRARLIDLEEGPPDPRRRTIAVCGAGPSGVELCCKLADRLARAAARRDGDGDGGTAPGPAPFRIVLVEASATILPGFREDVKARALALLAEKRVEVRLSTPVRAADPGGLVVGPGGGPAERIATDTILWTAGQRPVAAIRDLPVDRDVSGRLLVPATLELPGHPGIFALGDCAHCAVEGEEAPPATAQVAVQQSGTVARNVLARLHGLGLTSFRYFPLAEALTLGRGHDLFSVLGVTLEGRKANLVRRLAYLARLPTGRRAAALRLGARLAFDALGRLLGRK